MTSPVEKVEGTKSVGSPQQVGGKAEFSPPSDGSVEAASSNASSSSRGLNFFQLCKSFPSLSGSGGGGQVPTEQYIEAVNSLAEYISKLGLVFWSVRSDITNNCSIVRHYYVKNKEGNKYIEQLIANNKAETVKKRQWTASVDSKGKPVPPPVSTTLEALIWVHLSMTFFSYILHDLLAEYDASTKAAAADDKSGGGGNNARRGKPPTEDLVVFFRRAYEQTLAPHSTWLMNSLFEIILKGTPSRTQFLTVAMGSGPKNKLTEAEVFERMRAYLQLLEANNAQVKRAITQNGYSV